jgi:toxin HigB-1
MCPVCEMIINFANEATQDIYNGRSTKRASSICPPEIWKVARRKLGYLDAATKLEDLKMPPGNRLHPLIGDRDGQHAIRINEQYRICFEWTEAGPKDVEVTDYH